MIGIGVKYVLLVPRVSTLNNPRPEVLEGSKGPFRTLDLKLSFRNLTFTDDRSVRASVKTRKATGRDGTSDPSTRPVDHKVCRGLDSGLNRGCVTPSGSFVGSVRHGTTGGDLFTLLRNRGQRTPTTEFTTILYLRFVNLLTCPRKGPSPSVTIIVSLSIRPGPFHSLSPFSHWFWFVLVLFLPAPIVDPS